MKKIDIEKALNLLIRYLIYEKEDLLMTENRWVKHCLFVGIAAGRLAATLNDNRDLRKAFSCMQEDDLVDEEYAISLGYLHDIGRKINHKNHTIEGYKLLCSEGFDEEARICLTHSFDRRVKVLP